MNRPLVSIDSSLRCVATATLCIVLCGCGGMRQAQPRDPSVGHAVNAPDHQRIPVTLGKITASDEVPAHLRDAVRRYLADVAKAAVARHGIFISVDQTAEPSLLAGFGFDEDAGGDAQTLKPVAALDVHVERLEEQLGATVKVGLVSTQRKHATADVRVVLRSLDGGTDLASSQQGRSSKGAWGVIATVDRDTMREGGDVWEIDGSMIGMACAEAVQAGVYEVARQTRFRAQTLDGGIEKRLLRPGIVNPIN
jgi:hypothetical protein